MFTPSGTHYNRSPSLPKYINGTVRWSWPTLGAYASVYLACLGVFVTGISGTALTLFTVGFLARMWLLTVGFHRYFAHRSFRTSRIAQFVLALLGSMSLQGGVLWWAETHRRHHRAADTPIDLHSPRHQGFLYAHYGWFLDARHRGTRLQAIPDLGYFPELVWLDRHHALLFACHAAILGYALGPEGVLWGALLPVVVLWEITHWVQSFSHYCGGYRRWSVDDDSRNHWVLGVLALGEYHNNHHRFPGSARQGHVWWEFDLGYYLLKGLEWLKVVWDVHVPIEIASCGDLTRSTGTRALALKTTGTVSEASRAGGAGSKDGQVNVGLLVRTVRTRFGRALASAGILLDGPNPWDPQIHDPRFFLRVLTQGSLGVGTAYMDGLWDCEQLDELVARVLRTAPAEAKLDWQNRLLRLRASGVNLQTMVRARKAIEAHYDLDPEIFFAMLGPTMAYSCGYFQSSDSLDTAQLAKMDLICRKLGVQPSHRLLDIGCGWGSFVRYAAEHYGCEAIGVTISRAQHDFAADQHSVHGTRVLLLDYRDPALHKLGPFDRIVSVGMFEHVGRKNYAEFFRVAESLLTEEGLFLLHTIGNDHSPTDAWLNRYIFPNGMLPSTADIAQARQGRFIIEDWHNLRADYDRTIMAWYENFERLYVPRYPEMLRRFHRMWRYYLLSMAGAFRAGNRNQLWQIVLSRRGLRCGYHSVR